MTKALEGYRILDMSHVQAGPSCTQILAWLGADVIKVEMPGRGDITRGQLRDLPNVDSLYFTLLNGNKRSITINMKSEVGKEIFTKLRRSSATCWWRTSGPGVLDRQGFPWETLHEINPRIIYASIKGFGPGKYEDLKAYETVAQAMGGSMSTTGLGERPAHQHRRADRRLRHGHAPVRGHPGRAAAAPSHRHGPARGSGDAGQRAEPDPREDARSAAPDPRSAGRVSRTRTSVTSCPAPATRPAAASPATPALRARRRQRLYLRDHPAPGVGAALQGDGTARS